MVRSTATHARYGGALSPPPGGRVDSRLVPRRVKVGAQVDGLLGVVHFGSQQDSPMFEFSGLGEKGVTVHSREQALLGLRVRA